MCSGGKAEIEDLLFRPQNDHLLWAYFGVSVRSRRKSLKPPAAARLATKRRLVKALGDVGQYPQTHAILVRDPEAEEYSWPNDPTAFMTKPRWRYYQFEGHVAPDLLGFVTKSLFAWLDRDTQRYGQMHVPEQYQANLIELSTIHYDQILAVDEIGDAYHEPPHLLVDYEGRDSPFRRSKLFVDRRPYGSGNQIPVEELERHSFFPEQCPKSAGTSGRPWQAVDTVLSQALKTRRPGARGGGRPFT